MQFDSQEKAVTLFALVVSERHSVQKQLETYTFPISFIDMGVPQGRVDLITPSFFLYL